MTLLQNKTPPATHRGIEEGVLERAAGKRNRRTYLALLLPGLLGLLVSFVFPLAYMIRMSVNKGAPDGVIIETFTLETYIQPLTDPYYWRVTLETFQMGVTVGVLCGLSLIRLPSSWPAAPANTVDCSSPWPSRRCSPQRSYALMGGWSSWARMGSSTPPLKEWASSLSR